MSSPSQEPMPHAPSPPISHPTAHAVLSFVEEAVSREAHEAREELEAAVPNMLSRLASSSTPLYATPTPQQPVPNVFREHAAEAYGPPPEVPQRSVERTAQGPAPASASSHSVGSGRGRPITPPEGVARITQVNPALPDATHQPRPTRAPHSGVHRRMAGLISDSETAWQPFEDKHPHRVKCVGERLKPTIDTANHELFKATRQAKVTGWAQNIALGLQILLGALTTALGAALSGKETSVAVSTLGGATTLVASFLARTKSSNEPETSRFRAQALDQFLREIEAFALDHGHEIGEKWDGKIYGFRIGLEKILGNQPGTPHDLSGHGYPP